MIQSEDELHADASKIQMNDGEVQERGEQQKKSDFECPLWNQMYRERKNVIDDEVEWRGDEKSDEKTKNDEHLAAHWRHAGGRKTEEEEGRQGGTQQRVEEELEER